MIHLALLFHLDIGEPEQDGQQVDVAEQMVAPTAILGEPQRKE